ncbi:MAG: DUF202 domain-containing protein [Candidatus Aenigmarchaeota archaeon]|nr:DUF202 domain-containing protein [Candidatus Aenigmarchaeota archaeon]
MMSVFFSLDGTPPSSSQASANSENLMQHAPLLHVCRTSVHQHYPSPAFHKRHLRLYFGLGIIILDSMPKKRRLSQTENRTFLAMEQTLLSKERTILSFIQTGLAFIGVGIVVINVFSGSPLSVLVGSVLMLIGFVEIVESYRRMRHYQKRMREIRKTLGKYAV